jgi:hypothetical protein
MEIVLLVVGGNADYPYVGPVDLDIGSESLLCGDFKTSAVIVQPVEREEALVD